MIKFSNVHTLKSFVKLCHRFPNDRDTHGLNTVRMAKVWMDEYIDLFYMNRPDLRVTNYSK